MEKHENKTSKKRQSSFFTKGEVFINRNLLNFYTRTTEYDHQDPANLINLKYMKVTGIVLPGIPNYFDLFNGP